MRPADSAELRMKMQDLERVKAAAPTEQVFLFSKDRRCLSPLIASFYVSMSLALDSR